MSENRSPRTMQSDVSSMISELCPLWISYILSLVHTMRISDKWCFSLIWKTKKLLKLWKFSYDGIRLWKWCHVLYSNIFFYFQACVVLLFPVFFFLFFSNELLYWLNENCSFCYCPRKMFVCVPSDNFGWIVVIGSRTNKQYYCTIASKVVFFIRYFDRVY